MAEPPDAQRSEGNTVQLESKKAQSRWRGPFGNLKTYYTNIVPGHDVQEMELGSVGLSHQSHDPLLHQKRISFWQQHFSGWRMGVGIGAATAGIVLLVNIALVSYVTGRFETDQPGIYNLIDRTDKSCEKTKKWSTWLHLAINILGTLLLGASNYCMQCLSSPSRQEVDRAHSKGVWLDIGVPSVKNLKSISWQKILIWLLLGLSSIPLHLVSFWGDPVGSSICGLILMVSFNSVIFENLSANEYSVIVVNEKFISGGTWDRDLYEGQVAVDNPAPNLEHIQNSVNDTKSFQILSNVNCIKSYSNTYLVGRRNLLVVTSDPGAASSPNSSILSLETSKPTVAPGSSDPLGWICEFLPAYDRKSPMYKRPPPSSYSTYLACDPNLATASASKWKVADHPIEYCLSEIVPESCKLQFSLDIMIVVIFCNVAKLFCFIYTLWRHKVDSLVTIGDAIMSFLDDPDPTTNGMCSLSKSTFKADFKKKAACFQPWRPRRQRWFRAASIKRWVTCIGLCITALVSTGALLGMAISALQGLSQSTDIRSLWHLGFGAVDAKSLIAPDSHFKSTSATLMGFVLLGNLPQPILSMLYLMYNSLYTSMQMADEWSRFAFERKTLRVTSPKRDQRSTYFLQLPYRYGIPLTFVSGLMHWLVSQSIFLARVTILDHNGDEDSQASVTTCGFSAIAIIFTIGVGGVMVLAVIAMGFRRFKPGIPLAGSCSAAISAACHPPADDVDASVRPVMWGVVKEDDNGMGHCTFTSYDVHLPVKGQWYR